LHVLLHNQNKWDYIWNYVAVDTQWNYHQLSINLINQSEEYVRFRFIPSLKTSRRISMAIAVLNISTFTNCHTDKLQWTSQASAKSNTIKQSSFLILFGGIVLLVCTAIAVLFIYSIIEKQCNKLTQRRTTQRQQKARRTKNAIRDESTVLSLTTHPV
ncbi:unnamed protein product, partial [Adineta ricciae]